MLLNHCPGFRLSTKYPSDLVFCRWRDIVLNFKRCLSTSASISISKKDNLSVLMAFMKSFKWCKWGHCFLIREKKRAFCSWASTTTRRKIFQQIEGVNTLLIFCQNILKTNAYSFSQCRGSLWKRSQVSCLSRRSINCDYTRMALIQRMNGSLQGNFQPHNPEWLFHSSLVIRERPGWRFPLWNASKGLMALGI